MPYTPSAFRTELWAPIGLQILRITTFPGIPYPDLSEANWRLIQTPQESQVRSGGQPQSATVPPNALPPRENLTSD
jgi:hypothetical protein